MSSLVPWEDAKTRISAAIATGQPAPLGGLRCQWPNRTFDRPKDAAWLSVDASGESLRAIEMGEFGAWTEAGDVIVKVVVPKGSGTETARTIAKSISNLFRNVNTGPLVYERQVIGFGEPEDDAGLWWQIPVLITWKYTDRPA